jgi:hypothetical protein
LCSTAVNLRRWSTTACNKTYPILGLPLGWLVRENTNGQILVGWHPAPAMTSAVVLTNEQLAGFSGVEALLADTGA